MAAQESLDELLAPLREDNVSGASSLSRTAADVLRRAAIRIHAGSLDELRRGLGELCGRVLDAQPSMAPLVTLARRVMKAVDDADSLESGRHAAARAAADFGRDSQARVDAVVGAALEILPAGAVVATISASGTVRRLLETEAGPRGIRVVCFESRPMNEGRALAAALADAGVDVTYAVDAAIGSLAPGCDVVIVGTDAIGDAGVVNKIGSLGLARAARRFGVPVYVLADRTKLLPRGFPQLVGDDRPAEEVWEAPPGVTVWNRYFELTPMELVTGIVTESGVLSATQAEEARAALELPAELRTWATARMGPPL